MIPLRVLVSPLLLVMVESSPLTLGIKIEPKSPEIKTTEGQLTRLSRSWRNIEFEMIPNYELWTGDDLLNIDFSPPALSRANFRGIEHQTPDFSNGLAYPDTFLLTGPIARRRTAYLYSKELFFSDIPHIKLLLRNQNERKFNGLAEQRLGSIRSNSLIEIGKIPKRLNKIL